MVVPAAVWSALQLTQSSSPPLPIPLSLLRPIVGSLRVNEQRHREEVEESARLGYARAALASPPPPPLPSTRARVPPRALGLGPASPFPTDELVFTSEAPVLSAASCGAIRREAAAHIAAGGKSSFTMVETNRDANVHALPLTRRLLNRALRAGLLEWAAAAFPAAVDGAAELFVYRALVVQYDAAAGLTRQPVHRDAALLSVIISLSERGEYTAGGTWIEAMGKAIAPPQGHALLHPSALRHSGGEITSGERWVLVVFLGHEKLKFAEHGRRFKARAKEAAENGEAAEVQRLLYEGLRVCPDQPELWSDAGGYLHDRGDLSSALEHYEMAIKLNPADAHPHNNRGAALVESNAPPQFALQAFEYALSLDPYLVPAWRNIGGLLLAIGEKEAAGDVLASAPACVQADAVVASLRAAVEDESLARCHRQSLWCTCVAQRVSLSAVLERSDGNAWTRRSSSTTARMCVAVLSKP
ncbi:hypothetical protein AB1Y20_018014 [Prymnesium parvum]|uniref:Fe2OG dioxygenase domain-containing protein n=1 Tax=Prymnesium parvum TaxID=97485 RepID=A0AB34JN98_PRYPA